MDSLNDPLTCDICVSRYDSENRLPKVLQCGHTLCLSCLRQLRRSASESEAPFACPTCRRPISRYFDVPVNYVVLGMLNDALDVEKKPQQIPRTQNQLSRPSKPERGTRGSDIFWKKMKIRKVFSDLNNFFSRFNAAVFRETKRTTESWNEFMKVYITCQRSATEAEQTVALARMKNFVDNFRKQAYEDFKRKCYALNCHQQLQNYDNKLILEGEWTDWMCLHRMRFTVFQANTDCETLREFLKKAKTILQKKKEMVDGLTNSQASKQRTESCLLRAAVRETKEFIGEMMGQLRKNDHLLALEVEWTFEEFAALEEWAKTTNKQSTLYSSYSERN